MNLVAFTQILASERRPSVGRAVFRGLAGEKVMEHIAGNGLKKNLEVAVPVGEFTGDNSYLIYLANNAADRKTIVPMPEMIEATEASRKPLVPPTERVKKVVDRGFAFKTDIADADIDQIVDLWGKTFNWKEEEVIALQHRLQAGKFIDPANKDVWLSAVKNTETGEIAGLAMAERLSIPGPDGKKLDMVESTEWKVADKHAGNGIMPATLAVLNAQIIADLQHSQNGNSPLIFAECNFQSRADRVGTSAGFEVPSRDIAPQILVQNVKIGDGQEINGTPLRDFTFMRVPAETIKTHYTPEHVGEILSYVQK